MNRITENIMRAILIVWVTAICFAVSCEKQLVTQSEIPIPTQTQKVKHQFRLQFNIVSIGSSISGQYYINRNSFSIIPCQIDTVTVSAYTGDTIYSRIVDPSFTSGDNLNIRYYELFPQPTGYNTVAKASYDSTALTLKYIVQ